MPELPEVETTARYLAERICGSEIADIAIQWPRSIHQPSVEEFRARLRGARFADIARRGKFLRMDLAHPDASPRFLFAHLRMSGSFDVVDSALPPDLHDRVRIVLRDGREVRFHDPRKFGRFYLVPDPDVVERQLGLDPLDSHFRPTHLARLLAGRNRSLKAMLLDQSVIAGLGNIYVDEALWGAGLHPERAAASLSGQEISVLYRVVRRVLREAIRCRGTDNGDGVVHGGMYTPRCYGRAGQPCVRCKTPVVRIVVGQRGTHFCPRCQPFAVATRPSRASVSSKRRSR